MGIGWAGQPTTSYSSLKDKALSSPKHLVEDTMATSSKVSRTPSATPSNDSKQTAWSHSNPAAARGFAFLDQRRRRRSHVHQNHARTPRRRPRPPAQHPGRHRADLLDACKQNRSNMNRPQPKNSETPSPNRTTNFTSRSWKPPAREAFQVLCKNLTQAPLMSGNSTSTTTSNSAAASASPPAKSSPPSNSEEAPIRPRGHDIPPPPRLPNSSPPERALENKQTRRKHGQHGAPCPR